MLAFARVRHCSPTLVSGLVSGLVHEPLALEEERAGVADAVAAESDIGVVTGAGGVACRPACAVVADAAQERRGAATRWCRAKIAGRNVLHVTRHRPTTISAVVLPNTPQMHHSI